jgi:hypothetical protein
MLVRALALEQLAQQLLAHGPWAAVVFVVSLGCQQLAE